LKEIELAKQQKEIEINKKKPPSITKFFTKDANKTSKESTTNQAPNGVWWRIGDNIVS
jgi:hypothetical protein